MDGPRSLVTLAKANGLLSFLGISEDQPEKEKKKMK